jgi:tartrate dehydratase alpha subunit/fumarate hydratase class I-like protein
MLQNDILDKVDLTLRYTHNLDDNSWVFIPVVEWNLNNWVQLFGLGTVQVGGPTTEVGRFIKYQLMVGATIFVF